MAKYKLSNDYTFFGKGNSFIRNKLNGDSSVIEHVIIDDAVENIKGQEHKLELIEEIKQYPQITEKTKIQEPPKEVKEEAPKEETKAEEVKSESAGIPDSKEQDAKPRPNKKKESRKKGEGRTL